jgi:hypothetical protein
MQIRIALIFVVLLLTTRAALAQQKEAKEHNFAKWEKEIAAFEAADRETPPPKGGIVFTGSSTIRRWKSLPEDFPNYQLLNRGFGGCEILDCTHFADRIIFPYEPRAVFLRCGGNDIHNGKTAKQVFHDFKDFVAAVHKRLPKANIFYISQNPTIARLSQKDEEQKLNKLVQAMVSKAPYLKYIDVANLPLDANGQVRPELFAADKLHFNDAGNQLLAEKVRPYLPLAISGSQVASTTTNVAQQTCQVCCSRCCRRHCPRARRCR